MELLPVAAAAFVVLVLALAFRELARQTALGLISVAGRLAIWLLRAVWWLLVGWWAGMLWRRYMGPSW